MYPVVMMLPAAAAVAAVAAVTAAASAAAAVRSYLLKQVPKLHFVFVDHSRTIPGQVLPPQYVVASSRAHNILSCDLHAAVCKDL